MAKENSITIKREPTVWENIFVNDTSDKGLISIMYFKVATPFYISTNDSQEFQFLHIITKLVIFD